MYMCTFYGNLFLPYIKTAVTASNIRCMHCNIAHNIILYINKCFLPWMLCLTKRTIFQQPNDSFDLPGPYVPPRPDLPPILPLRTSRRPAEKELPSLPSPNEVIFSHMAWKKQFGSYDITTEVCLLTSPRHWILCRWGFSKAYWYVVEGSIYSFKMRFTIRVKFVGFIHWGY